MDALLFIFVGVAMFVIYVLIAKAIFEEYRKSKGIAAFFWFMLFIMTLSFLFASSSSSANTNSAYSGGDDDGGCSWNTNNLDDECYGWDSNSLECDDD